MASDTTWVYTSHSKVYQTTPNVICQACFSVFLCLYIQMELLQENKGRNSIDTIRRVIKMLMVKELALTFSLTGLGPLRKRTKHKFEDHAAGKLCHSKGKV